ncbi:MAG: MBL fold metallo-hydrolase [Chloroflexi bacterium]|nr:MAG: MBL fold metallo-hydrolase [Chloroflexota bacterium]
MKIRFWGTRGSIPTPGASTVRYGGNTACVEVRDSTGSLLILDAGTGLRELGASLMNGGGPRPFSVDLLLSHLHWDHIQGIPQVGRFRVRAASLYHPSPALAYRLEADGRSLVYATDTEDPFSGRPNPVIPLANGADMLIHDAQYLDSDFKPTWGHSTIASAIDVATKAKVKRLVLYHHDPDRTDEALDRIAQDVAARSPERTKELEIVVAREGMELTV